MTGGSGEARREPGSASLVVTLTAAGLFSGLLLAAAYELTLPTIEANRRAALRAAVFQVVPGTATMQKLLLRGDRFEPVAGDDRSDSPAVYAAYGEDRRPLGFAIPGDGPGFQDTIALLYGYDPRKRRVVGMQVLESRETPGLGDKIFKDRVFVAEFADLAVEPAITVVKHGAAEAAHEVDGITGATISSKAVVRILNRQNSTLLGKLPALDALPPAPAEDVGR
jgi:electron transport complex protein RnfG